MNLSDCTKADLLWIIKQICKDELSDHRFLYAYNAR